jgi:membrane protein implicated in regulation of membrane protease activity
MNWQNVLLLAIGILLLGLVLIRSVRRIRLWIFILVGIPTIVVTLRWANFRSAWFDLGVSMILAIAVILIWWQVYGRRLPPPQESQIKVWTEDDPF